MEEIVPGLTWMDLIAILLSTLCQFISGKRFYQEAYRGIQTRALGMGFLVALGTTCAYFFGLFSILHSVVTKGDVTSYSDNLMTSTMLITFVLFGKYLEARAKSYTSFPLPNISASSLHRSVALEKLLDHQPATAILLSIKPNPSREGHGQGQEGKELDDDGEGEEDDGDDEDDYYVESERVISTDLLEENDIVKVVRGMTIPVDGEIIHGAGEVNEALITGEAMPVNKSVHDDVIGGTQLQEGVLHIKVRTVPEHSVLQQIIKLVENAQMEKAPIQQMADQIAGVFALIVISISLFVFVLWFTLLKFEIISREYLPPNLSDFVIAFTFSISSLVVACPCAMGLATPTAIMVCPPPLSSSSLLNGTQVGTGVGAKIGILIKGGEALETANKLTTIVFDKTGTLTMVLLHSLFPT
jgi:P-type Cu+ transporter